MPLPKSVMDAAARADELQKQYATQQQPAPEQTPSPAPENGEPPKETPAPAPEAPKPEAPSTEAAETWKKRFDVLSGKYNAEVPRLAAQLREASATIRSLTAEVEAIKAKPA